MSFNFNKDILQDKQIQEIAKNLAQVVGAAINTIKQNVEISTPNSNSEPKAKDSSPLQPLISQYESLIGAKFQHRRKGTTYILNEVLNTQSDNFEKTPVMITYYDINKKTKWCRPLTEFHSNFSLIT